MMSTPIRGEVWYVEFNPQVGQEIGKIRPAVVASVPGVGRLPLHIVVPVTEWKPNYAGYIWFVYLPATSENGLQKDSGADAFQVKSVARARFRERIGSVLEEQMEEIVAAITLCVGG